MWDALPNLKVLDHCDRTGAEVSEEEDDEYDEEDDDDYEEEGDDGGGDAEPGLAALVSYLGVDGSPLRLLAEWSGAATSSRTFYSHSL